MIRILFSKKAECRWLLEERNRLGRGCKGWHMWCVLKNCRWLWPCRKVHAAWISGLGVWRLRTACSQLCKQKLMEYLWWYLWNIYGISMGYLWALAWNIHQTFRFFTQKTDMNQFWFPAVIQKNWPSAYSDATRTRTRKHNFDNLPFF